MSTIEEALKKQKIESQSNAKATKADTAKISKLAPNRDELGLNDNNVSTIEQVNHGVNTEKPVSSKEQTPSTKDENNKQITLNFSALKDEHFLVPDNNEVYKSNKEQQMLNEEFRQIKRKLLNNAFGVISKTLSNPNLIMVSSAQANEGKTFVSINLALSLALEQDKTVLLVDCDVLRPSIPKQLGFTNKVGLINYLVGECENLKDIIYPTNIDNLKIIPAGRSHHLANELIASEKMAALCSELQQRYPNRVVLFDSPPLLGVNETAVLAQLMGQALLVVEENRSSIHEIQKANELLPENLAKGVVLNKAIHAKKEMYGYYGYGYGNREKQ